MVIWVTVSSFQGNIQCSTHLTEKGALRTAIPQLAEAMGIFDYTDLRDYWGEEVDSSNVDDKVPEWAIDEEQIKLLTTVQLDKQLDAMLEFYWESYDGWGADRFEISVEKTQVAA